MGEPLQHPSSPLSDLQFQPELLRHHHLRYAHESGINRNDTGSKNTGQGSKPIQPVAISTQFGTIDSDRSFHLEKAALGSVFVADPRCG